MQKVSHVAVDDTLVGGCRFEYGKHIIMLNICVYVMLNIYVKHITVHVIPTFFLRFSSNSEANATDSSVWIMN